VCVVQLVPRRQQGRRHVQGSEATLINGIGDAPHMIEPEVPQKAAGVPRRPMSKEPPTWNQQLKSQLFSWQVGLIMSLPFVGFGLSVVRDNHGTLR
jgi:hypothetical protein